MPLPRRKVQRQIPLHHIKRDDVPNIHRHQVHRKEIHLPPRIALMLRPGNIGCVRSLAAKRRRLHLDPQKPPILFHPNVITGRVPMRTRHIQPPVRRPRHKTKFRPLAAFFTSLLRSHIFSHAHSFTSEMSPPNRKRGHHGPRTFDALIQSYQPAAQKWDTPGRFISPTVPSRYRHSCNFSLLTTPGPTTANRVPHPDFGGCPILISRPLRN